MKRITSTLLALVLCGCASAQKNPDTSYQISEPTQLSSYIPQGSRIDYTRSKPLDSNDDGIIDTIERSIFFLSEDGHGKTTLIQRYDNDNRKIDPNPLAVTILERKYFQKDGKPWVRTTQTIKHDSGTEKITRIPNSPKWYKYDPDGNWNYEYTDTMENPRIPPPRFQPPTIPRPKPKKPSVA